ncbi:hypothetical protein Sinac_4107 [Singulisphaera acidiphila DSM 18658]|uniref:Uncharacterized protein n=1 Tax=Singulisphaera acidiphila (strain ATCC BAA-1392 / DSM 18658 / VKM B-2454 / MOB10) TaxID=886293 RepID=L0DI21_SINAD|nr:hypothetical protein Sinac_4107 [Singulisphaera acidiphila DSM 18658]
MAVERNLHPVILTRAELPITLMDGTDSKRTPAVDVLRSPAQPVLIACGVSDRRLHPGSAPFRIGSLFDTHAIETAARDRELRDAGRVDQGKFTNLTKELAEKPEEKFKDIQVGKVDVFR